MSSQGRPHRPEAVAAGYRGLIDGFVVDGQDAGVAAAVERLGIAVLLADTLAERPAQRAELARSVVGWAATLPSARRRGVEPPPAHSLDGALSPDQAHRSPGHRDV